MVAVVAMAISAIGLTSCQRVEPLDERVAADTPQALLVWRGDIGSRLKPAEWALFDESLQELKLKVMRESAASGSEKVDAAMRELIRQQKVGDVIRVGLSIKWHRLVAQRTDLEKLIQFNARLRTNAGDDASAEILASTRRQQDTRLENANREIFEMRQRILPLFPTDAELDAAKQTLEPLAK